MSKNGELEVKVIDSVYKHIDRRYTFSIKLQMYMLIYSKLRLHEKSPK